VTNPTSYNQKRHTLTPQKQNKIHTNYHKQEIRGCLTADQKFHL
jgi:hypothetical protein